MGDVLSEERYLECCDEATVDAYGRSEEIGGWFAMLEQHLPVPFETTFEGNEATITMLDLTANDRIVASVRIGGTSLEIGIEDLPIPGGRPIAGWEWIAAYQRWASESE